MHYMQAGNLLQQYGNKRIWKSSKTILYRRVMNNVMAVSHHHHQVYVVRMKAYMSAGNKYSLIWYNSLFGQPHVFNCPMCVNILVRKKIDSCSVGYYTHPALIFLPSHY